MSRHNHLGQPIGEPLPDWVVPPLPQRVALDGRYCRLEPLDAARHADELYAANAEDSQGRMWTYLSVGPFDSLGDYRAWVAKQAASNDPLAFAIVDRAHGAACGTASYLRIAPASGSLEVGQIAYAPRLQKTPAATEAMYLLMQHAFALGYRRYEWKCDALNAASRAAAQRLSLSFEGVFRQAIVYKGRNRDTAWFAAIDREWPALREQRRSQRTQRHARNAEPLPARH
jgi:RimJ/RimL family protein N-acetyltransferase